MIDSYDVLWSSYDRHKLIYKVMIMNKNESIARDGKQATAFNTSNMRTH